MSEMSMNFYAVLAMVFMSIIPALLSLRILNKAGYSRWWALLVIVPILNVIMVWVFAYGKWPALIIEDTQR